MIDDVMNRLKVRRGSDLPQSKLTDDDVMMIRQLVEYRDELKRKASELTNKRIADKFSVHQRTIDKLIHGRTWSHVQ